MTPSRPAAIDLVVDTSAILALSLDEPPTLAVRAALEAAHGPVISAATLVEPHIVTTARFGPAGASAARTILDAANVVTMPVDAVQADSPQQRGVDSGGRTILPGSPTATASRTRSHTMWMPRCCASATTSPKPTSRSST